MFVGLFFRNDCFG